MTFAELWAAYEDSMCPHGASENQRIIMRDSFYSGAAQVFGLISALLQKTEDNNEFGSQFVAVHGEILAYFERRADALETAELARKRLSEMIDATRAARKKTT